MSWAEAREEQARCEVCLLGWPLPHLTLPRAPAVMGSLALAGVRMAVECVGVMVLPVASSRGISLSEGAPWAIRRSCGSRRGPPIFTSPSSDPVPITSVRSCTSVLSPSPSLFSDLPSTHSSAQQKAKQEEAGGLPLSLVGGGEGGWPRCLFLGTKASEDSTTQPRYLPFSSSRPRGPLHYQWELGCGSSRLLCGHRDRLPVQPPSSGGRQGGEPVSRRPHHPACGRLCEPGTGATPLGREGGKEGGRARRHCPSTATRARGHCPQGLSPRVWVTTWFGFFQFRAHCSAVCEPPA